MLTAIYDYLTLDHAGAAAIGGVLTIVLKYVGTSGLTAVEGAASFIESINTVAQSISAQAASTQALKVLAAAPVVATATLTVPAVAKAS